MDFDDTAEEAAFRAEVAAWLQNNAPRKSARTLATQPPVETDAIAAAKAWQAKKFDAGYAAITWPRAYGGRDGSLIQEVIYRQEERDFIVDSGAFSIGLGMCIPIVRAFGSDEHKLMHIRPALRGETIWCQLFSEPSAGSDVAGIRTRAVR